MAQLGELLIASGHLTQEGLEEALDWQVLYGGRLGTNLLELKLVEEEQLALALGKQKGCEVAWGWDLQLDPALLSVIPKQVADRQELIPWKLEKRRLKLLCTEIRLQTLDELGYRLGRPCTPVVAPEFRVFNLLRAHFGAMRQMRALDFGVVPEEGRAERKRKKVKEETGGVEPAPELIDEAAFNDIYAQVLAGREKGRQISTSAPEPTPAGPERLEELPDDAILEPLPGEAIEPTASASVRDQSPLEFSAALRALEGVTDRDSIAHIVLRASRNKAARALLLQVQGGVALGWDGLGEGLENGAARAVAVPLSAPSAFQLVVNTRGHFMGPLQKTRINIRFLVSCGRKIPLSSLLLPILHKGRVSHLLYLDNGHQQQAPTDVGEMLILSQRIGLTVEALVARKRRALRG